MFKRICSLILVFAVLLGLFQAVSAVSASEEKPETKGSYPVPAFRAQPIWEKIARGIPVAISHKSDWRNFPENSLLGINSCINMGVDIIEVDFHVTKDGVPVALHDDNLRRVTNADSIIYIHEITWAQAKKYALEDGMGNKGENYILTAEDAKLLNSIPTYVSTVGTAKAGGTMPISRFDSILEMVNKRAILVMDKITTAEPFSYAFVCAKEWDMVDYVLFKGNYTIEQLEPWFEASAALWNKKHPSEPITAQEVKTSIIYEYNSNNPTRIQALLDAGVRVIGLAAGVNDSNESTIRNTLVPYCREKGIYLRCNTGDPSYMGASAKVDCEIGWAELFDIGYTGVMTDRPGPLVNYIQERYRIRPASDRIDAEHFTNYNQDSFGFTVPEDWNAGKNKTVDNLTSKDTLIYENIEFDGTENILTAKVKGSNCSVTVYLDGTAAANKVGTLSFNSTSYTSAQVKINPVTAGTHTVYLKFSGTVSLDQFRFTRGLYFGFSNERLARFRYQDRLYGSLNYDTGNWFPRPASMSAVTLDNTAGTMSVNLTAGGNHYIQTGTVVGDRPLHYIPQAGDYFQMRLKVSNVIPNDATLPMTMGVVYSTTDSTDFSYANRVVQTVTESQFNGSYFTLTLPMNSAFINATEITGLRLYFTNLAPVSGKTSTITIDQVYIGPKAHLPQQDYLYFDFTDRDTDEMRYMTSLYGYQNFDNCQWLARTATMRGAWYDPVASTLLARVTTGGNHYIQSGSALKDRPLHYTPSKTDYLQMVLRIDNGVAYDASLPFSIGIAYASAARADFYYHPQLRKDFPASVSGSGFFTVTIPMPTFFTEETEVQAFRIYISNLAPVNGEAIIEVDSFYIGAKEKLPKPLYTVTFANEDGTVLAKEQVAQGDSATYAGTLPTKNFDEAYHYSFKGWNGTTENITKDATLTAVFHAIPHSYNYSKVDTANHTATCSCGYSKTEAHSLTSAVTTTPTCTAEGVNTFTCSKCSHSHTEAISATGHTPVTDQAVAATCTTTGKTEGSHCAVCNAVIKAQTAVPATGHTYTSKVTTAATCTTAGVKTYTCSDCSHSYTEAIPAAGHTPTVDQAVAPTCTNSGLTEGSHCAVCGVVLKGQEPVGRLGHDYRYTDNGDGTHTGDCTRCDKMISETHQFTNDTCFCGSKTLTVDESIKIYHTLDLASDISVTFAVPQTALASYDSYYLEVVLPEYEGNAQTGTSTVQIQPVVSGSYYYFTLTGITAVRMGDLVDATLHMTRGTAQYISVVDTYSVATYAYGMLNSSKDAKMLTLCADLLRYGAEAQSFKGYRTDSLIDANMTEAQRSYLSDTNALSFTATDSILGDLTSPIIPWVGKTLDLGSKVGMKFVFNAKNYSGDIANLSMKVTYQGSNGETKTVTLTGAEVYSAANKYYSFTFYGLLASELRTVVDVAVYEGNTQLTQTLRYSAESYASKNTTGALGELCKALFAYSDSAKAYFTK